MIESVGSLETAAHCFVAAWRKTRSLTTTTPQGLSVFKDKVEGDLFDRALDMSTRGVCAQSHAPPVRNPQNPYPSVRDHPTQSITDLRPDLLEGRISLFTCKSEDKLGPLMETKLSFVEQKDLSKEGGLR